MQESLSEDIQHGKGAALLKTKHLKHLKAPRRICQYLSLDMGRRKALTGVYSLFSALLCCIQVKKTEK